MSRASGHPKWLRGDEVIDLEPISLTERHIDEAWLQRHLDAHPELLPIEEVGAAWGPLVSLGREIATTAGPIDNLFVSPSGELTVVETKLWRNPEARRKVIGQVLDYAAALSRITYDELDDVVGERADSALGVWDRVCQSRYASNASVEADFIDTVRRNLRTGSFLLLIVGDGIREDLEGIAQLLRQHPGLRFHLALVELRLFHPTGPAADDLVIVPSVVGESREVIRAVIDVQHDADGSVKVNVVPPEEPDEENEPGERLRSLEHFVERATDFLPSLAAEAIANLARWWQQQGGSVRYNRQSINLAVPYSGNSNGLISVMTIYLRGRAEGSVNPLTKWQTVIGRDEALERFRAAGFDRGADWPIRYIDLTQPDQWASLTELLTWVANKVATAEGQQTP